MAEKFNKLLNLISEFENYNSRIKSKKDEQKNAHKRPFKVRKLRYSDKLRTLVKLRIACHNLRVETGRYHKIPLDERICPLCSVKKIEDETHLLLDCQRYSSMRDIFLSKTETKIDDIRKLSHENLISQLMNSNDFYVNLRLIMFISSCFEMREKFI